MRSALRLSLYSLTALVCLSFSASARATSITLVGSSAAYPGYEASNAVDQGSNKLVTDFAGNGTGVATYLDFALVGGASHIDVYDRTTSGGANNSFNGGTTDFTSSFELIFSNDSTFSSSVATQTFVKATPSNPTSLSSFLFSANFAPVDAKYVRYQVLAANGANPGVADISLSNPAATPEPSSLMLLGTGILGAAGIARRRLARNV